MLDNKVNDSFSPRHQPSDSSSFASLIEGKGQLQVPRPGSRTAPYEGGDQCGTGQGSYLGKVKNWSQRMLRTLLGGRGPNLQGRSAGCVGGRDWDGMCTGSPRGLCQGESTSAPRY